MCWVCSLTEECSNPASFPQEVFASAASCEPLFFGSKADDNDFRRRLVSNNLSLRDGVSLMPHLPAAMDLEAHPDKASISSEQISEIPGDGFCALRLIELARFMLSIAGWAGAYYFYVSQNLVPWL